MSQHRPYVFVSAIREHRITRLGLKTRAEALHRDGFDPDEMASALNMEARPAEPVTVEEAMEFKNLLDAGALANLPAEPRDITDANRARREVKSILETLKDLDKMRKQVTEDWQQLRKEWAEYDPATAPRDGHGNTMPRPPYPAREFELMLKYITSAAKVVREVSEDPSVKNFMRNVKVESKGLSIAEVMDLVVSVGKELGHDREATLKAMSRVPVQRVVIDAEKS